jgi:hypothetical protein
MRQGSGLMLQGSGLMRRAASRLSNSTKEE